MQFPERLLYFDQQFLRVEDFTAEQVYHRDMRRRHNRMLHTPGISNGLKLTIDGTGVNVSPGAAIGPGDDDNDGGAEIVLAELRRQELSALPAGADAYVTIRFDQQPSRFRDDAGVPGDTRWLENPIVEAFASDPTGPTNSPDGFQRVLLGRVTRTGTQVASIDGTGRRLAGAAMSEVSLTPLDDAVAEPDWVRLRWSARGQADLRGSLRLIPGASAPGNLTLSGALEAGAGLRARSLRIDNGTADRPRIEVAPSGLSFFGSGGSGGPNVMLSADSAGRLTLGAAIVASVGSVGVGTQSPSQMLQVAGNAQIANAFVGDVGHGAGWTGFAHASAIGTLSYGLLHSSDGRNTLINKRSGGGAIEFRIDNGTFLSLNDAGLLTVNGPLQVNSQIDLRDAGGGTDTDAMLIQRVQRASDVNDLRIVIGDNLGSLEDRLVIGPGVGPAFSEQFAVTSGGAVKTGTLQLRAGTVISEFSVDAGLGANSDALVPTQRAVRTYIDRRIKIQAGDAPGTPLQPNGPDLVATFRVNFPQAFGGVPTVRVYPRALDADQTRNIRYDVWPDQINATGFTVFYKSWADTRIYNIVASWIAYGPG